MKRLLVIMLIAAMALAAFTACGKTLATDKTNYKATNKASDEELSVALDYSIERIDWSIYNEEGEALVDAYYDLLTVNGAGNVAETINETLQSDYDEYAATAGSDTHGLAYHLESYPYTVDGSQPFFDTVDTTVTYNDGRYFSVECSTEWFMGGVHNRGYYGFVFDAATGELVGLDTLFPDSLQILTDIILDFHYDIDVNSYQTICDYIDSGNMSFDDFSYCISSDGEIIVLTKSYAMNLPSAASAWEIPTGIFIEEKNKTFYSEEDFENMFIGQWARYDAENDLTYFLYFGADGEMTMTIGWGRVGEAAASGSGTWSIADYSDNGSGILNIEMLLDIGDGTDREYSGSLRIEVDTLSPRITVVDGDIPLIDGRYGSRT